MLTPEEILQLQVEYDRNKVEPTQEEETAWRELCLKIESRPDEQLALARAMVEHAKMQLLGHPGMRWNRDGNAGLTEEGQQWSRALRQATAMVELLENAAYGREQKSIRRDQADATNEKKAEKNAPKRAARRAATCARYDELIAKGYNPFRAQRTVLKELGNKFGFKCYRTVLNDIKHRQNTQK